MSYVGDPEHVGRSGGFTLGRAMGWFLFLSSMFWPRLGILAWWIFSNLLGRAYDSAIVPIVGFFVLPWTTVTYAMMWGFSSDRVSGRRVGRGRVRVPPRHPDLRRRAGPAPLTPAPGGALSPGFVLEQRETALAQSVTSSSGSSSRIVLNPSRSAWSSPRVSAGCGVPARSGLRTAGVGLLPAARGRSGRGARGRRRPR